LKNSPIVPAIEDFVDQIRLTSDPELRTVITALFIEELTDVVLTDEDIVSLPVDDSDALIRWVRNVRGS
jgi:hypothetical protein